MSVIEDKSGGDMGQDYSERRECCSQSQRYEGKVLLL